MSIRMSFNSCFNHYCIDITNSLHPFLTVGIHQSVIHHLLLPFFTTECPLSCQSRCASPIAAPMGVASHCQCPTWCRSGVRSPPCSGTWQRSAPTSRVGWGRSRRSTGPEPWTRCTLAW